MSLWAVWIGVALSLWSCSSSGSGSTKDVVGGVTEVSPVDGTCDDSCDLQCEQGLPGQACTYCQAACLCRCAGEQGCVDSSCAMVLALNASSGDDGCPQICP
jgi:hypothetical protein